VIGDTPYEIGYAAYGTNTDAGIDDNPYTLGSDDWYEWREGWLDAEEHVNNV